VTPTTIFADTGGFGHMDGYGWAGGMNPWWILMVVLMVGFVIWAIIWTTQRNSDSTSDRTGAPPATSAPSTESILADRFARGEIDEDEYRRRLDVLRS
jgi:putative membrane protein